MVGATLVKLWTDVSHDLGDHRCLLQLVECIHLDDVLLPTSGSPLFDVLKRSKLCDRNPHQTRFLANGCRCNASVPDAEWLSISDDNDSRLCILAALVQQCLCNSQGQVRPSMVPFTSFMSRLKRWTVEILQTFSISTF